MKIIAIPKKDNPPVSMLNGARVELQSQFEFQVTEVKIDACSTTIKIKWGEEYLSFGSEHFTYELVLDTSRTLGERRVEIDIVDDLLLDSYTTGKRWTYSDDMPAVSTSYVLIPS